MATHLAGFAAEAGIELRTVKAQRLELCDKVEEEINRLRGLSVKHTSVRIIEDIICVVKQRLRKAHSLIN